MRTISKLWVAVSVTCAVSAIAPLAQRASSQPLADGEHGPPGKLPKCVTVRTDTPYRGFGFDHVVSIENGCKRPVLCTIVTDINDQPASVRVDPGKTESVTTFRGSPSREFKADVSCKEVS
jgi:hypothetical protein